MSIYVDKITRYSLTSIGPAARRVGQHWCHLWCDAGEDEALHLFAACIGMRRAWYQQEGKRWPHYDLTPRRRAAAIAAGAIEMNWRDWYKSLNLKIK